MVGLVREVGGNDVRLVLVHTSEPAESHPLEKFTTFLFAQILYQHGGTFDPYIRLGVRLTETQASDFASFVAATGKPSSGWASRR